MRTFWSVALGKYELQSRKTTGEVHFRETHKTLAFAMDSSEVQIDFATSRSFSAVCARLI